MKSKNYSISIFIPALHRPVWLSSQHL